MARWSSLALLGMLGLDAVWAELRHRGETGTPIEEASLVTQNVPQGILDSILNGAAGLAKVPPRATGHRARRIGGVERRVAWLARNRE